VDVRLDHEGIGPYFPGSFWLETMTFTDNQVADHFNRFWLEQADVVTNPPPIEIGFSLLPITNIHDMPERPMLLGKVLQFVVVQIAPQANGGEHQDLPVVEPLSPAVAARVVIDILGDKVENFVTQLRLAIDVLQRSQDRNYLITTVEIECDLENGSAIESLLSRKRFSHPVAP